MPISFDSALGIHAEALKLRGQRSEVLASNLANMDTPNYKARDFDFHAAPIGPFSIRGIFDQEDPSEPYHHDYRLWVKNYSDLMIETGLDDWESFR